MAMPQKMHEDDPKWMGMAEDPVSANAYLYRPAAVRRPR